MAKEKVVIIGGGVSGLSSGIYALQHGFDALIVEKNSNVGGLCTGWNRKGIYLDGCIHWLTGTKENTELNKMWKNVHAFSTQDDLIYLPTWGAFEYQGTTVTFYQNLAKAEQEWINISKEDTHQIKKFFRLVKLIASFELPLEAPISLLSIKSLAKTAVSFIKTFPQYELSMKMSCEEYANKFHSPALRFALTHAQPGDGNLYSLIYSYATIATGNGRIPKEGSVKLINNMRDRFLELGGSIIYKSPITSINVNKHQVTSISIKDHEDIVGDYYISSLDLNFLQKNLLKNKYKIKNLDKRFFTPDLNPAPSCVLISYLVKDMEKVNIPFTFECEPFEVGDASFSHLTIRSFSYDPTYIHKEKTVVQVLIDQYSQNYAFWDDLKEDKEKYLAYKLFVADEVKKRIETRFPSLKEKIETLDVASPYTFHHYVNASRGSYMGYLFTARENVYMSNASIKGISNLLLAGQYVQCPGGLPLALSSGKFAIQRLIYKKTPKIIRCFNKEKRYYF